MIEKIDEHHFKYNIHNDILEKGIKQAIDFILHDDNIEEIMYDSPNQPIKIYHKKHGLMNTNIKVSEDIALKFIQHIAEMNSKVINAEHPLLDGTLWDGSRVNATVPPASPYNCTITIRKFARKFITMLDLIKTNTLSAEIAAFLWCAIEGLGYSPSNVLVVGGTASGKTTFLNTVTMFAPKDARIIIIEDTAELQLKQVNTVRMLSKDNISMDALLKNALRMRPDRIVVGEVRGSEAVTLFEAMNTGHDGCMGTLHANTARECVTRAINPPMNVPKNMFSGLDLIVVLKRIASPEGQLRVIEEITEIASSSGEVRFNKLYYYDPKKNTIVWTGVPSKIRAKISKDAGITPKKFDFIVKDRTKILSKLTEIKKEQDNPPSDPEKRKYANYPPITEGVLFDLIEKNRNHWRDEVSKGFFDKKKSSIKRFLNKEDVMHT